MLVADLSRFVFNNREQTLVGMGKREECQSVQDVEEGEISDSASVEEISEEDFINPEAPKVSKSDPQTRVWTMRDLYKYQNKYQTSSNYASGLYNLAWAQAVQNKPLDEILVMDFNNTDNSTLKRSASSNSMNDRSDNKNSDDSGSATNKVVIDVSGDEADDAKMEEVGEGEKEEGELEEGEIDLDSEVVGSVNEGGSGNHEFDVNISENELEKRVNLIREGLQTLTVNDVEKSYDGVCSRLQNSLDSLGEVVLGNSVPNKDALVQLSFSAIQTVNSVFCSMSQNKKEQNRDMLSRLLVHVMSQKPALFSPEQMKEIEVMIPYLDSHVVTSIIKDGDKEKEIQITERVNWNNFDASGQNASQGLTSIDKCVLDSISVESLNQNNPHTLESSKIGVASSKGRGALLLPLLDLHKDHDADSLPSPTRETTPYFPVGKALVVGDGTVRPEFPAVRGALETENAVMHPYETDALKAVSFYQQKFGQSSFHMNNRLPSPTPSEEGDDGDGDTSGEVSSSSIVRNANPVNAPTLAQPIVSSMLHVDISGGQGMINARNVGPITSGSNSVLRAPTKSRDPRLRFANSDTVALDLNQRPLAVMNNEPKVEPLEGTTSSRKQKNAEESVLDGPAPKRQRNEFTDSGVVRDVQAVSGTGGWLEDRGTVGMQVTNRSHVVENKGRDPRKLENAVTVSGTSSRIPTIINDNGHLPVTSANTTASLHSLLKDIAVNPAMWMNILKTQQQKAVDPVQSTTQPTSSNSILGAVPATNVAPPKPLVPGQRSAGILQTPQTAAADELGKIRMKPRDPRRVLHSNSSLKGGSLGSDQSKTNTSSALGKGSFKSPKQEDQLVKTSISSQSIMPPDIARQFTKNLKNIADIMSVSQSSSTPLAVPQIPSSQPVQVHPSWVDIKGVVSESGLLQSGSNSASEEVAAGTSRPQNTWGEVEHLFEGFDDQQKAAIQRERVRRIEEQKKMFAARKLCLVLDLDHTLLNSAKFVEIEPAHDELLRKKEEQDREKPQRHLFRFPHMGMWTKLRPGIWNFLEKASKLYELHLYTMGNKLYATEMAKVLDPKGVLFSGRVISKGDDGDLIDGDERVPKSKDLEGVLGMESAVVIIDDSIRVWPHNKLNLIVVERYIYFPCSRRQFGLPGPSLLEIDHDERPEDGTLASSLAVIEKIHQNFFLHESLDEGDVRNILASEQQKILGGCRIVFSRVFPVGEANPHLHPLWQTAEQFGAVCTNQIDEQVTHVVANSLGTDKVNWALSTGRFVVHPGWVEASALLYRRANEHDFAIKQ